jgi:hypothetical protein
MYNVLANTNVEVFIFIIYTSNKFKASVYGTQLLRSRDGVLHKALEGLQSQVWADGASLCAIRSLSSRCSHLERFHYPTMDRLHSSTKLQASVVSVIRINPYLLHRLLRSSAYMNIRIGFPDVRWIFKSNRPRRRLCSKLSIPQEPDGSYETSNHEEYQKSDPDTNTWR